MKQGINIWHDQEEINRKEDCEGLLFCKYILFSLLISNLFISRKYCEQIHLNKRKMPLPLCLLLMTFWHVTGCLYKASLLWHKNLLILSLTLTVGVGYVVFIQKPMNICSFECNHAKFIREKVLHYIRVREMVVSLIHWYRWLIV